MSRLLVVSDRLPVTVTSSAAGTRVRRSSGGLASGLRGPHERSEGLWIGRPGDVGPDASARADVERRLRAFRAVPVWLDPEEAERFQEGFADGVLWPLFHYLLEQIPLHVEDWDAYARVNERFAEVVAGAYRPGDRIWIHDYQLMLLPQLLRARLPAARIGFFLHVPFPSSEVLRVLPGRDRLLEGLLGADLIGFHTAAYMRHFASSLLRVLGIATDVDRVRVGDREVSLGVFPLGIDPGRFATLAADAAVLEEVRRLRTPEGCAVLAGVDRLDSTTGIPRRLLAFETLLRTHPELRERVRLVQVAVPSRGRVRASRGFRRTVAELVARVNREHGTPRWTPVHYRHRSLPERNLVALYRAADVLVATPVRDGMHLVAKEFVATRVDGDGVLVLSELAGAAAELAEAVLVNPYDVDRTAEALSRALGLPERERRTRMQALRTRVLRDDVHHWVRAFLAALDEAGARRESATRAVSDDDGVHALVERIRLARHLLLLLDYDGTLVPFASVPELATPDEELLGLLRALAARPGTAVHVVSGRTRETLEGFLGGLPVGLHAEHGFWSRPDPGGAWRPHPTPAVDWRPRVLGILEDFTARTPGSLVEEKTAGLAWHYRMVEPALAALQANELRLHLSELLSNVPVEILSGEKVVEVRPYGISKGLIVGPLVERMPPGTLVVALGDDRTDEDLFAALPPDGVAVHVGPRPSAAAIRLVDVARARRFLAALVAPSGGSPSTVQ